MFRMILLSLFVFVAGVNAATFTVNKTADSNDGVCDSDCSLRDAVAVANSAPGDDVVRFAVPDALCPNKICQFPLNPTFGYINAGGNGALTIQGNGWFRTIITIAGANSLLLVNSGVITVNDIRLAGGTYPGGGTAGAGFSNAGTATLNRVSIDHNVAQFCHGVYNIGTLSMNDSAVWANGGNNGSGGGMCNTGAGSVMTIRNSSITSNFVTQINTNVGNAGGINNSGTLTIVNSTIDGNYAAAYAGGIYNSGVVEFQNVSLSVNVGNTSIGGMWNQGTARSRNTMIAENYQNIGFPFASEAPDIASDGTMTSLTNNIMTRCANTFYPCGLTNGVNNDVVGNASGLAVKLTPLGRYGGNSFSRLTFPGSIARDAGNDCVKTVTCATDNPSAPITTDQRGAARSNTVDIGATENDPNFVAALPAAYPDVPYDLTLVPDRGAFSYTTTAGSLPPGMSLTTALHAFAKAEGFAPQAAVALTGTPTATGLYNFTVTISDGASSVDVKYSLAVAVPTAAGATISGRAVDAKGNGIARVAVTLTDPAGRVRTAITNSFGLYRFEGVAVGDNYVVSASSRRFRFANPTRVLGVAADVADVDFVADIGF